MNLFDQNLFDPYCHTLEKNIVVFKKAFILLEKPLMFLKEPLRLVALNTDTSKTYGSDSHNCALPFSANCLSPSFPHIFPCLRYRKHSLLLSNLK